MILDILENLRREAYVRAVIKQSEFDNVVGYVGYKLPIEIFYAMNLTAYPIYGIDEEILQFSSEKNLCPLIDATITYAKTDKCPLIHSSKLIVIGDTCKAMTNEILKLKDKNIYVYDNEENLISKIKEVYNTEFNQDFLISVREEISVYIQKLKRDFNLSDLQAFNIEYFTNFLNLDERMNFLENLSKNNELKNLDDTNEFVNLIFHCISCKKFEGGFCNGRLSRNVGIVRNGRKNS